jgi:Ca2+-binding EF-hand superfamily protein
MDSNGDGVISRVEIVRFIRLFLGIPHSLKDAIDDTINEIWKDFDTDRSGKLNRRETMKFMNAFLKSRGQLPATYAQFSKFFDKFDVNKDG